MSMTGYGSGVWSDGEREVRVEARSVNHRYSDIQCRLPKGYQAFEESLRRIVTEYVQRGRVEIFVTIEEFRAKERTVRLDPGLLKDIQGLPAAAELLGSPGGARRGQAPRISGRLDVEEAEMDVESVRPSSKRLCGKLWQSWSACGGPRERGFTAISHIDWKTRTNYPQDDREGSPGRRSLPQPFDRADPGVARGGGGGPFPLGFGSGAFRRQGQHRRRVDAGDQSHIAEFRKICARGAASAASSISCCRNWCEK